MDASVASNPQHYQPLSHALHPPLSTPGSRSPYPPYSAENRQDQSDDAQVTPDERREEEEEEEEEEEDEVAGALDHRNASTDNAVPLTATQTVGSTSATQSGQTQRPEAPQRRRPGRPKGSKNKKPRFDITVSPPKPAVFPSGPGQYYHYPPPGAMPMQAHPPPHPGTMPSAAEPGSQQFYDFQWRVLTLCSEFYNAADELIRGAPPHVIAQCFSLPGNHVDPISILNDARRACDTLMANPSQTVLKPLPAAPVQMYQSSPPPAKSIAPLPPAPPAVISNPGTFVMSMGPQGHAQPPGPYGYPPPMRYPTSPYYFPPPPAGHQASFMAQQQMIKPVNLQTPASAGNQGAWSDEETEKLKKLAEDSRGQGEQPGDVDWDWVCSAWGAGRTRHQILIKATSMGMKESSTRGMKRRRETEPGPGMEIDSPAATGSGTPAPPGVPVSAADSAVAVTASTVVASQQASAVSTPARSATSGTSSMPWPMPHVAATSTPAAVVTAPQTPAQGATGRSNYYRERPNQSPHLGAVSSKPTSSTGANLQLMYPNGNAGPERT